MTDELLTWIADNYSNYTLPIEDKYLEKYFKTDAQRSFLLYYHKFGHCDHFTERTGFKVDRSSLKKYKDKFNFLKAEHKKYKDGFQLAELSLLSLGKFKLPEKYL